MEIQTMVKISGESISTLLEWEQVHPFVYEAVKAKCIRELKNKETEQSEDDKEATVDFFDIAALFVFTGVVLTTIFNIFTV